MELEKRAWKMKKKKEKKTLDNRSRIVVVRISARQRYSKRSRAGVLSFSLLSMLGCWNFFWLLESFAKHDDR